MTLTEMLRTELLSLPPQPTPIRAAELATLLRFAGGLHLISGRMAVEIEVESRAVADHVAGELAALFGVRAQRSATPGLLRCGRVSGDTDVGKSV